MVTQLPSNLTSSDLYGQIMAPSGVSLGGLTLPNTAGVGPATVSASGGVQFGVSTGAAYWFLILLGLLVLGRVVYNLSE